MHSEPPSQSLTPVDRNKDFSELYLVLLMCNTFVIKGVDRTGLLGDIKEDWGSGDPCGVQKRNPGRGSQSEAKAFFCETAHNICVKIQQTAVAVTRVGIINDITAEILGGHYHRCPPFINIRGKCPPCPIDAPVCYYSFEQINGDEDEDASCEQHCI